MKLSLHREREKEMENIRKYRTHINNNSTLI